MSVVEVWWSRLGQVRVEAEWVGEIDGVERERLAAYRRDVDQKRFLVGCTMVRRLVARRLQVPPASIRLDRTCSDCGRPHGKVRTDGFELSVTHSGELVGVAIHPGTPIGLDVERIDPTIDALALARMSLAPQEMDDLLRQQPGDRPAAFTTYWSRKEAVVKATGAGMRAELPKLVVSPPGQPAAVLDWPEHSGPVQLVDLEVASDHRAALAALTASPIAVSQYDAAELLRS